MRQNTGSEPRFSLIIWIEMQKSLVRTVRIVKFPARLDSPFPSLLRVSWRLRYEDDEGHAEGKQSGGVSSGPSAL